MLDLSSHGDSKEDAEIDQQNGPKDRDIEDAKEAAKQCNNGGLGGRIPVICTFQQTRSLCAKRKNMVAYQNLNSGSRRINGLNSSSAFVGKDGPSSISFSFVSISNDGSNLGVKNARNRFNR